LLSEVVFDHLKDLYSRRIDTLIGSTTLIEPTFSVSRVLNELFKNNSYDAFYLKGSSVLATNLRFLLTGKDILDIKVKPFLTTIPSLTLSDTIQKAANIMTHYRLREVPVVDGGKIIGSVSAKSILRLLAEKNNKWITANLLLTKNPITVSSKDSLAKARKLMVARRIDHLPVFNKGAIRQVLTSFHIINALNPQESLGRRSLGMEKIRNLESQIGNIGSTRIPQCKPNDNLNTILDSILKTDTTCCLVNLWNNLQGIITYRDILSLLALKIESDVPLYIVGMPEDQKNVDLITSKLTKTLKRLQKVYSEIQEAKVTVKQQRVGRKRKGKFEVSMRILTPHHLPYIYTEIGFDLSNVIENLSQRLLRNLTRRSKRRSKVTIRKVDLPIVPV